MPTSSKWLSNAAWEKRIRRALNKYGYSLHKSRKWNGGYTVSSIEDESWFSGLDKLQDLVEYLRERHCE